MQQGLTTQTIRSARVVDGVVIEEPLPFYSPSTEAPPVLREEDSDLVT